MIKTQKKQSHSFSFILLFFCTFLLATLFFYSLKFHAEFFIAIAAVQAVAITYLFVIHYRLIQKKAEADLRKQDHIERMNLLQSEIVNERFLVEAWHQKALSYQRLKDLTEKLSMCLSLADTSKVLSSETHQFFGKRDVTTIIYIFHSETGELGISSSQKGRMQVNIKSKKGDTFDEWVVKTMQSLLIEDVKSDFRFDSEKIVTEESRKVNSLISIPLIVGSRILGILRVDSPQENYFNTEDLRVLKTISDLGAVAIENAQLYERVEELSIRDSLTGLYLRRYLLKRLNEEISRQLRRKKPLSFLMIDLDRFKKYNDKYGHMAGDIVLKTIGSILLESFKDPGSLVCRYGGEEFAILLPDYPKGDAIKLAEEIRKRIENCEITLRKGKTNITVSIGVATFPTDSRIKKELIHAADSAMYQAKGKGRNRVCSF